MKFRNFPLALWHAGKRKLSKEFEELRAQSPMAMNLRTLKPYISVLKDAGYVYTFDRPFWPNCGVPLIWKLVNEHDYTFVDEWTIVGGYREMMYMFRNPNDAVWVQMVIGDGGA